MNARTTITITLTALCFGVGCATSRQPVSPVAQNRALKAELATTRENLADTRDGNRERRREQRNLEKSVLQMQSVVAAIRDPEHHQIIVPPVDEVEVIDTILDEPLAGSLSEPRTLDPSKGAFVTMPDGRKALRIVVGTSEEKKDRRVGLGLPIEKLVGKKLRCTVLAKGEAISKPPVHWGGGKFQLWVRTPEKSYWPAATIGGGTFDWKPLEFFYDVPFDATAVTLFLGLEKVSGTIYFRDLNVQVVE
jgi:hypothetical protein